MRIIDFLKEKLIGKTSYEFTFADFDAYCKSHNEYASFKVAETALFITIDLIAKTLSKCRFCTVENGKEVEKKEFYAWNYRPNKHQTKYEFICEFITRLFINNEALIVETIDGQRLIASSFSKQEKALIDDIFEDVTVRGLTLPNTFYSSDVIYLKYHSIAIAELMSQVCRTYEELMQVTRRKIRRSGDKKAIVEISAMAQNNKSFKENFEKMLNDDFRAYFGDGDVVLPTYDGIKVTDTSSGTTQKTSLNEVNDLSKLMTTATEIVANTLHIPPALIRGEASQLDDAENALIANAIDPVARAFDEAITAACYGERGVLNGSYLHIDTTYAKHLDPIYSAVNIDKAIASRVLTPAQAQRYCNMVPDDSDSANSYYLTKNYQTADLAVAEGGENNA